MFASGATMNSITSSEESEAIFVYDNIARLEANQSIKFNGYTAYYFPVLKDFTCLCGPKNCIYKKDMQGLRYADIVRGWKLHVSINDEDLSKAWPIFLQIAISHQLYDFKVIREESRELLLQTEEENGKQITVYAFKENRPVDLWQEFMQELTQAFVDSGIKPGPLPLTNTTINGCNYISYRNDGAPSPNLFESIVINVEGQPARAQKSSRFSL